MRRTTTARCGRRGLTLVVWGLAVLGLVGAVGVWGGPRAGADVTAPVNADGPVTLEFDGNLGGPGGEYGIDGLAVPIGNSGTHLTLEKFTIAANPGGYTYRFPFTFEAAVNLGGDLLPGDAALVDVNVKPQAPDWGERSFFGGLGFNMRPTFRYQWPEFDVDETWTPNLNQLSMFVETAEAPARAGTNLVAQATACPGAGIVGLIGKAIPGLDPLQIQLCQEVTIHGAPFTASVELTNARLRDGTGYTRFSDSLATGVSFDGVNPVALSIIPTGGPVTFRVTNLEYRPTISFSYYVRIQGLTGTIWASPRMNSDTRDFPAVYPSFPNTANTELITLSLRDGNEQPKSVDLTLDSLPGIASLATTPPGRVIVGSAITVTARVDGDEAAFPNRGCDGHPCIGFSWDYPFGQIVDRPVIGGVATWDTVVPYTVGPTGRLPEIDAGINVLDSDGVEVTARKSLAVRVGKRLLEVKVDPVEREYGDPNPPFSVSYSGFLPGEGPDNLDGTLTFSTTANQASGAGAYWIETSGLTSSTYDILNRGGILTVRPRVLHVSSWPVTKRYGDPTPALTVRYVNFANGDGPEVLTGSAHLTTTVDERTPVGVYGATAGGTLSADNYWMDYGGGPIAVQRRPLTVSSVPASRVYGDPNPTFTPSFAGFVNGDGPSVLTGSASLSTAATTTSNVGLHAVTVTGDQTAANYAVDYAEGTLAVTKRTLVVSPADMVKRYGDPLPACPPVYTGFVNGDTAAVLSGTFRCSTGATAASHVGTYSVGAGGTLTAVNYSPSYAVRPALRIDPAPLTVAARNVTTTYWDPLPTLVADYQGFVLGEGPGVLGGTLSLTTSATASSNAGTYPIVPSGLTSTDYAITFVDGLVTILRAPTTTTLAVGPVSPVYGQDVTLTATVAGPGTPTGSVQFVVDGVARGGPVPLGSGGRAVIMVTGLNAGTHQVVARYSGEGNHLASEATGSVTVARAPTSLVAEPAVAKVVPGARVTIGALTARLTNTATAKPAAGRMVMFTVRGEFVCSAVTGSSGVATCTGLSSYSSAVLSFGYDAAFTGDANLLASTGHGPLVLVGGTSVP